MLKVIDIFKINDKLSVTLDGMNDNLKNGCILIDDKGKTYKVLSVAMIKRSNNNLLSKNTTILIDLCDIKIDDTLRMSM